MELKLKVFIKKGIKAIMPYGIILLYRRNKLKQETKEFYGNDPKSFCPVCGKESYFMPFGNPPRQKARCAHCGALERHRLLWLFFEKKTKLFAQTRSKILHVAAEKCFSDKFKKMFGKNYLTADLKNPYAMIKMDITDIHYPNESFDVIICNHVLEHIPDDRKAMNELYRILKKNGWAVLLVPVANIEKTYEDFSIVTKVGRTKAFGQHDHVRKYGNDYIERLKSSGFIVTVVKSNELATNEEIKKMCLKEDNKTCGFVDTEIFYCTK